MKRFIIFLFIVPFVFINGCSDEELPPPVESFDGIFTFHFENKDSDLPIHIFITGESFGPNNKLQPGKSRTKKIQLTLKEGYEEAEVHYVAHYIHEHVKITAGRNGKVLETKTYIVLDDGKTSVKIYWNGNKLYKE